MRIGVSLAALLTVLCSASGIADVALPHVQAVGYGPGTRVLLDAHNAYPERGRWTDRIDHALATGTPIAIEQDLYWSKPQRSAEYTSVVAHDDDALAGAPTLEAHFFERIRPRMEEALMANRRETWPLITLNLDFKDNIPEHLDYIWSLLARYEPWLTVAPKSPSSADVAELRVGPLLVLCGADTAQRRRFHDDVPVGASLRAFGAIVPTPVPGRTKAQRLRRTVRMSAAEHIAVKADNFARWVNFPWSVVEEGGQNSAGAWTAEDSTRLASLVQRAHQQRLWIRFYTLDGFTKSQDRGFSASYNFGSLRAARVRWRAAISAGVDFIATDHYGEFAAERVRSP